MQIQISGHPASAQALIQLGQGELIRADGRAVVSVDSHILPQAARPGDESLAPLESRSGKALVPGGRSGDPTARNEAKRSEHGGVAQDRTRDDDLLAPLEVFSAKEAPGEITLSPALPGGILSLRLDGEPMLLQAACYLASTEDVSLRPVRLPMLPFPLLEVSGEGELLCSGFGALREEVLSDTLILEPGHLVAFAKSISLRSVRLGGWRSFLFWEDEGGCALSGAGRLILQSQSPSGLARRLGRSLPPRQE